MDADRLRELRREFAAATAYRDECDALAYSCSADGGWPPAESVEPDGVIVQYRALELQGFVREIPEDATVLYDELRLHFVATEAGHEELVRRELTIPED